MLSTIVAVLGACLVHSAYSLNCSTSFLTIQDSVNHHKPLYSIDDTLGTGILKAFASTCEADREMLYASKEGPLIIDIGSNKGSTLLRYFTIWSNLEDIMLRKWYPSQGIFEFDLGKVLQSAPQVYAIDPLKPAQRMMSRLISDFN